jgi:hypothetical protein
MSQRIDLSSRQFQSASLKNKSDYYVEIMGINSTGKSIVIKFTSIEKKQFRAIHITGF